MPPANRLLRLSMPEPYSVTPVKPIPYGRQSLDQAEIDAVIEVLRSPWLTQGPKIAEFEAKVAEYCDIPYAVAFSNGTAALHAACFAAGLGPGDEGITTPITFVATSNAVLYQQARPVFADIDPETWNLCPKSVEQKLTPRTKALLPVHFAGQPVDLQAFYELADRHNLTVIEDACHALGAVYQGKPIGHCRDMAVFSFHPVKSITTGEGGMVVTPHRHVYDKLIRFRTHGITRDPALLTTQNAPPWHYEMQMLGYNYRMTDIQAAMGVVQMQKLDGFITRRNHLVQRYRQAFQGHSAIEMQAGRPSASDRAADHLFIIRVNDSATRLALFQALSQVGIHTQVHYSPVHLQPYYRQHLQTRPGDCPHAEAYAETCLSLPLYPDLADSEQDDVIAQVRRILAN